MTTISEDTLLSLKEYIMERFKNMVKTKLRLPTELILGYFCTESFLSPADCKRFLNRHLDDLEEERASSNVIAVINRLKKENLIVEKVSNYDKFVNPTSDYYTLSSNGIYYVFKEGFTGYHSNLIQDKNYRKDKLFKLFLDPYIPMESIQDVEDYRIISTLYEYLTAFCIRIEKLLDELKEVENLGGFYTSGFITMFFVNEKYKDHFAGSNGFIKWISEEHAIGWNDISRIKLKRVRGFEEFEISDGMKTLKLQVYDQDKKAVLTEKGNTIVEFLAEKYENSYYQLRPLERITVEEYLDEYLDKEIEQLAEKQVIVKLVTDIIDLYSLGKSKEDQKRNEELLVISENSKFKKILETVEYEMDERYQKLLTLYQG